MKETKHTSKSSGQGTAVLRPSVALFTLQFQGAFCVPFPCFVATTDNLQSVNKAKISKNTQMQISHT